MLGDVQHWQVVGRMCARAVEGMDRLWHASGSAQQGCVLHKMVGGCGGHTEGLAGGIGQTTDELRSRLAPAQASWGAGTVEWCVHVAGQTDARLERSVGGGGSAPAVKCCGR